MLFGKIYMFYNSKVRNALRALPVQPPLTNSPDHLPRGLFPLRSRLTCLRRRTILGHVHRGQSGVWRGGRRYPQRRLHHHRGGRADGK